MGWYWQIAKKVVIPYQVRSYQTHATVNNPSSTTTSRNPLSSQVISNLSSKVPSRLRPWLVVIPYQVRSYQT